MSWWQALETGWPGLPMLHQSCKWTLESGNNATKMMKWYVKMFNWGSLILNLCSKTFQNGLWANFPMSQKYPRCFGQSPKIALQNWLEIQSLFFCLPQHSFINMERDGLDGSWICMRTPWRSISLPQFHQLWDASVTTLTTRGLLDLLAVSSILEERIRVGWLWTSN